MAQRKRKKGRPDRVAVISLHTSPRDQPGTGDAGGMNVYILSVAQRLAEQGVAVDIFTRCRGDGAPEVQDIAERSRLIQVQAGPCAPLPKDQLPKVLPDFLDNLLARAGHEPAPHRHSPYDVVHSHYWLSGWVGSRTKRIWGAPLVASFHTLAKVKNASRASGDRPEPVSRVDGERRVVHRADRILAPTALEAGELVGLYGADPDRIRIVPPGVDGKLFFPRPKEEAKARLGLPDRRLLLFVGRLQPLKAPDVAIRALAELVQRRPDLGADAILAVVGGSAAARPGHDEAASLRRLAVAAGVADRVLFFGPQPHERLAEFYSAAEAVLVPSRSESFGLVALEAQSCGTPVIAAASGGLRYSVLDGSTGLLVKGHHPAHYADAVACLLERRGLWHRLSAGASVHAGRFSWEATAQDIRGVYQEVLQRGNP